MANAGRHDAWAAPPTARAPVPGPVLFGRYAFGPNRLGYCGTDDHAALLGHAAAQDDRELRVLARTFEGAYPYLELIARSAGIPDPLDRRVVEAYWLGNDLTASVTPSGLHSSLDERFRGRLSTATWRWLEASVPAGARPVHAFHVLDVFPRIGLLRGGEVDDVLKVIDSCRIRWARVASVQDGTLTVEAPALAMVDGKLRIGPARSETVERWLDGIGFVDDVRPGDMVSLHWGWACDRLTPRQLANLVTWTEFELVVANRTV
jgi:hypothetical protein